MTQVRIIVPDLGEHSGQTEYYEGRITMKQKDTQGNANLLISVALWLKVCVSFEWKIGLKGGGQIKFSPAWHVKRFELDSNYSAKKGILIREIP